MAELWDIILGNLYQGCVEVPVLGVGGGGAHWRETKQMRKLCHLAEAVDSAEEEEGTDERRAKEITAFHTSPLTYRFYTK